MAGLRTIAWSAWALLALLAVIALPGASLVLSLTMGVVVGGLAGVWMWLTGAADRMCDTGIRAGLAGAAGILVVAGLPVLLGEPAVGVLAVAAVAVAAAIWLPGEWRILR